MKDTFLSDDPYDWDWIEATRGPRDGLRHAIRPRQGVTRRPAEEAAESAPVQRAEPEAAPLVLAPARRVEAPAIEAPIEDPEEAPQEVTPFEPLPLWDRLPYLAGSESGAAPRVALSRDAATARAFDLLRTRLRQTTQDRGWIHIGVSAPTSGCGTTYSAVNLALSLSRLSDCRTLLMDFNLAHPALGPIFGLPAPGPMADLLSGERAPEEHLIKVSERLALGLNGSPDPSSAETLQDPRTAATLADLRQRLKPQVVLYDLPPMLVKDDVSGFLPQLDGMLLVSDGTQTVARELLECERMLEGQVPLLGVILNRARRASLPRYS